MIISQNISVSCTTHSTGHSTSIVVDGDTSDTVTMGADGSYINVHSISDTGAHRDSITLMFKVTPALRRMLRLMDMELRDEDESDSADAAERVTQ